MKEEDSVIHKIFSESASKFHDKVALQIKKGTLWQRFTYKEIETYSLKVGAFLIKEGFKKGEFAVLILENRPEWVIIYLGIMYAGLTGVPLDPQLSPQEIRNLIIDSGAKIIFCSYDIFINKINPVRNTKFTNMKNKISNGVKQTPPDYLTKIVVLDIEEDKDKNLVSFSDIERISPNNILWPTVLPEDIASLIYTSGTTAKPKGVLLSHKNICSNFRSIQKLNLCFPSDNFLSILPLYHSYAFMVTLIVPIFLGARVTYFVLSFKPQDISQVIQEAGVTILVGVPQVFSLLHKTIFERIKRIPLCFHPFFLPFIKAKLHQYLGSLRLLVSGGARLQAKIARDLSRLGFKLIEGYGLTETSPVVTFNPPQRVKFGSVGKSIPDVQIKIDNPDRTQTGQILIRGPNVMKGYFKQPDATLSVIRDGWFYSGDLGYLDREGYLYLVGREKEIIVLSSGKNIYPEELEEYYCQSPYIKEICVLDRQEERFGRLIESLHAIVVPNLEYFRQRNETDIRGKIRWELENLSKNLSPYKHIMGFTITKEELPRTALKKTKRYEVRQKYLEEKFPEFKTMERVFSEEDQGILNRDITKKIINYISGELNKPVYLNSHLEIDLGIDSLTRVELGLGLEVFFSIKIPDEVLYSAFTVKEVIIKILDIIDKTKPPIQRAKELPKTWAQILSEPARDEILKKIRIESSFLDKLLTWIFKSILLLSFRVFWFLKIKGTNLLPHSGPYILCPNHASYLDGFFVFSSLPLPCAINTFFLGYTAIFEHPLVSWAVKIAHLISIDSSLYLIEAMQAASYVLRHKKVICIFPEGGRSISDRIGEFKKGIGILAKELDIPVIPVYIKGSHYSWPRGSKFPRACPVKTIFGRPFDFEELRKEGIKLGAKDDYEAIALGIRQEVTGLKEKDL